MYWQREYLRENVTMTRGETYRVDLPRSGLLGSLLFRISAAGVSGAFAQKAFTRIIDFITKVEVIANGAIPIKSLTGSEIAGIMAFDQGIAHPDYWHQYATGTRWCHLLLNFGRFLKDPAFGLDLSRFDNVELRITNNASSTYYGEDFSLSILQYLLRDAPGGAFGGYFRTEEWRSWTTVADETKYLELPTELPVRRVFLQAIPDLDSNELFETGMWNLADDLEFTTRTGTIRVYKGGLDDLMWENAWAYGHEWLTSPQIYGDADYGKYVGLGYVLSMAGIAGTQDGAVASAPPTIEGRRTDGTQKPEAYEADTLIECIARGLAPENMAVFRFDQPDDRGSYLDVAANRAVQLDVHTRNASSAADGEINVVLDRLVR